MCHCAPGFYGVNCEIKCGPGYYGDGCHQECPSSCGGICNPVDGSCNCKVRPYCNACLSAHSILRSNSNIVWFIRAQIWLTRYTCDSHPTFTPTPKYGHFLLQTHCPARGSVWFVSVSFVPTPPKAPVVSLSKKLASHWLVLVGFRNGFELDFTIEQT